MVYSEERREEGRVRGQKKGIEQQREKKCGDRRVQYDREYRKHRQRENGSIGADSPPAAMIQ